MRFSVWHVTGSQRPDSGLCRRSTKADSHRQHITNRRGPEPGPFHASGTQLASGAREGPEIADPCSSGRAGRRERVLCFHRLPALARSDPRPEIKKPDLSTHMKNDLLWRNILTQNTASVHIPQIVLSPPGPGRGAAGSSPPPFLPRAGKTPLGRWGQGDKVLGEAPGRSWSRRPAPPASASRERGGPVCRARPWEPSASRGRLLPRATAAHAGRCAYVPRKRWHCPALLGQPSIRWPAPGLGE